MYVVSSPLLLAEEFKVAKLQVYNLLLFSCRFFFFLLPELVLNFGAVTGVVLVYCCTHLE